MRDRITAADDAPILLPPTDRLAPLDSGALRCFPAARLNQQEETLPS